MKIKQSGIIEPYNLEDFGIRELLLPSFFIGFILPVRPGNIERISPEDVAKEKQLMATKNFADGQFVLDHQYEGYACTHRTLLGIFLPLSACSSPEILLKLLRVTREFHPKHPHVESVEKEKWIQILHDIGPLIANDGDIEEAFIRVRPSEAYPWLQRYFTYVTSFSGPSNDDLQIDLNSIPSLMNVDPRDISRAKWRENVAKADAERFSALLGKSRAERIIHQTESLPWKNIAEFSDWLCGKNISADSYDIYATLLYENSD